MVAGALGGDFKWPGRRRIDPSGEMLPRNIREGFDPVRPLVEAGQKVEFLASRGQEGFPALDSYLLQRFEAVGDETRADNVHAAYALAPELGQRGLGVGLYPGRAAEARLEGD